MATGPIQYAAQARLEKIAGVSPKDQAGVGLRGFARTPKNAETVRHTARLIHTPIAHKQGKLSAPGTNNLDNHA